MQLKPLCVLASLLLLCACSDTRSSHESDALQRVKDADRLVIAYADEEPYGYLDTTTNRGTGEAPEIARVVAQALAISTVEPVLTEWKSLIPGLKAGRFDCIAAGIALSTRNSTSTWSWTIST